MNALVVVESMFGNTHTIAEAVGDGLATGMAVRVVDVRDAPAAPDVDLLVVGGPTHAFSMSRPRTREDAINQAHRPPADAAVGIREWLAALPPAAGPRAAAAFDTKVSRPRFPGSAAHGAGKRLRRLGYRLVDDPATFWVEGTPGPLSAGEVERARTWGQQLMRTFEASAGQPA